MSWLPFIKCPLCAWPVVSCPLKAAAACLREDVGTQGASATHPGSPSLHVAHFYMELWDTAWPEPCRCCQWLSSVAWALCWGALGTSALWPGQALSVQLGSCLRPKAQQSAASLGKAPLGYTLGTPLGQAGHVVPLCGAGGPQGTDRGIMCVCLWVSAPGGTGLSAQVGE